MATARGGDLPGLRPLPVVGLRQRDPRGRRAHDGSVRAAGRRRAGRHPGGRGSTTEGVGYVLSRRFTDGADLSGGEWQRFGLARALFAAAGGAGVLVLDEPTAQLDVRAEAAFYDQFFELTRGLTTMVISHRSAPSGGPTGSWCWMVGGWWNPAATTSSWPPEAGTRRCSGSRRRALSKIWRGRRDGLARCRNRRGNGDDEGGGVSRSAHSG